MGLIAWQPGLSLGNGLDKVRGEPKQLAVTGTPSAPDGAAGQEGDFSFVLINSSSDFDESIGVDASLNVGIGLFGGSAKFKFRERCKVSSQATFCILRVNATNAFTAIDDPKLTADARELLELGKQKRFRERFGDVFVSGQFVGVEFYGVVRIEANKVERQREIAADIQASYGLFMKGGASVNSNLSMSSAEHRIEIYTYQRGGSIRACTDLPEVLNQAKSALEEGRNGRGYPFAMAVDPYNELKLPKDDCSFIQTEMAERALRRIADHIAALQRIQNDYDFALRNQPWFEPFDVAKVNEQNRAITSELNTLGEKADVCSRDFDQCQDYQPAYPELVPLIRKAGAPAAEPVKPPAIEPGGINPAFLRLSEYVEVKKRSSVLDHLRQR